MEKVIEILKKHNFENIIIKASRIFKLKETDKTDEEILEETAEDYIKFLLTKDRLTDEEDTIIMDTSVKLLAREALKTFNINAKIDEPNDEEKVVEMLACMMAAIMK